MDNAAFANLSSHRFGLVTGAIDLSRVDAALAPGLRRLVADHGVVVFRDQALDDAGFAAWLTLLGPMLFTPGETPLAHAPQLNAVSNVGRDRPPRSVFHTDSSYLEAPPAFTALRAVSVPRAGGATLFSDQVAAAARLDAADRERLAGRTLRHRVTGLADQTGQCRHPLLRRHPETGRVSLYLSTPERCDAISGMDEDDSAALVERLYAHSTRSDTLFVHHWQANDVVIWDDRTTLHKADHSAVLGDRVLHRGMVAGEVPLAVDTGVAESAPIHSIA